MALREDTIRLAHERPDLRPHLLPLINANRKQASGEEEKLTRELQRMVGHRGKVIHARWWGGGEWTVVFNSEHAALYAYWKYAQAGNRKVRFGESSNLGGYYISNR